MPEVRPPEMCPFSRGGACELRRYLVMRYGPALEDLEEIKRLLDKEMKKND